MAKGKKGMTKKDIENKLKILKTDREKFSYLKELSPDILSPKQEKAFYKTLGDYALKVGEMADAVEAYKKAGRKEGLIKAGDKCLEKGWIDKAIEAYKKAGKEIDEALNRTSEKFEVYLNKISKLSGEQSGAQLLGLDTKAYEAIKYLIYSVDEMVDKKIIPKNERDKVLSKLGEMLLKKYEIFAKNPIYCCFRHDESDIETGKKLLYESLGKIKRKRSS
ncbi:MAG: hypothetical protein QXJ25_03485 [Candidatus Aenigmatarchaeota archaeon]